MKQAVEQHALADYVFPVALEDTLPLDATEALPLPSVEYIGIGDQVVYERLNQCGAVVVLAHGVVININYTTQQVQLFVKPALRLWVDVSAVSLSKIGAANSAAFTAALPAA